MKQILLIIDAQNDFILPDGTLPVNGAVQDMEKLINHIKTTPPSKIVITMDAHTPEHIATQQYWTDASGNPPPPFTVIRYEDAVRGLWKPHSDIDKSINYLKELESKGKHHTIWPEHCVYGTKGWEIYEPLAKEINTWLYYNAGELAVHHKGTDIATEMFSAVLPEVSYNKDDESNAKRFISLIDDCESLLVAGEAENFCVKETVRDIVTIRPDLAPKITVLRECMSAIPVPNDNIEQFWTDMQSKGVKID